MQHPIQRGAISALLFSFYINDMIKKVDQLNIGCSIWYHNFNIISCADDICLIAPSATELLKQVEYTNEKLSNLCLKINVSKCCYWVFRKPVRFESILKIMLLGRELNRVARCKYLGVIFFWSSNMWFRYWPSDKRIY